MRTLSEFILESSNRKYVNAILVSPEKEILILRRANYMKKFKSKWGFPGGSFEDKDKNEIEATIREVYEETKIELSFKEKNEIKKFETVKNDDGSISEYYLIELEEKPKHVKISGEHSKYEWYSTSVDKNYQWMPNIYQIIQKYLMNE